MADNFHFDISCAPLGRCLEIAFLGSPSRKASHWRVDEDPKRLVLAWHEFSGFTALPAPVNAEVAEMFVKQWLLAQDYGSQPDHDGDNGKSHRIYNETWGQVAGCSYAFVAIEPLWAMYGK